MTSARPALLLLIGVAVGGCAGLSDRLDDETLQASIAQMAVSDVTRPDALVDQERRLAARPDDGYRDALRKAVLRSDSLQASVRELRSSQATIRIARSALLPQLTGSATAGAVVERNASNRTGAAADLSVSQLLFDGGATAAQIDATTARAYAAQAGVLIAGNEAAEEAARAWVDVWHFNARLSLLRARVAEVDGIRATLEQMISNGFIDRASLAAAERQVLDIRLEEEQLQASLRSAQTRFNRLLGYTPGGVSAPQSLLARGEPDAFRTLWRDAPELVVGAANLIALERDLQSAQAGTRPTVAVRAGVTSPLSSSDNPNMTVGLTLQHRFGDGGRRAAEIEALQERLAGGRLEFEDGKAEAEAELEANLSLYRSLINGRSTLARQIEVIERENSTLRSQLASGQATLNQVVEGEVRYYRARARQLELAADLARLEIGMMARTGVLTQRLGLDLDSLL